MNVARVVLLLATAFFRCLAIAVPSEVSTSDGESSERFLVSTRIVGGSDSGPTRYPYYVSLVGPEGSHVVCGGTLIASDVVLTAAHCNVNTDLKFALVGNYDLQNNDNDSHEKIEIIGFYENPGFDFNDRSLDQMVLKLARPSSKQWLTVNIDPNIPAREARVTVVGLGRLEVGGDKPDVLQQVTLDYVPNEQCSTANNNRYSYQGEISPDMICVEGGDTGQCNGDSGGPYLLLGGSATEDVQVGTVSWGFECNSDGFPGVGSRTSASDFIRSQTCLIASEPPEGLCTTNTPAPSPAPSPAPAMIPEPFALPEPPASCVELFQACLAHPDCCSGRCVGTVCRTSSSGGSKTSVGRANGMRGGAGGG